MQSAIAAVQLHAKECKEEFPAASKEVLSNMYVDDCLTGYDSVEASVELQMSLDKRGVARSPQPHCLTRSGTIEYH